MTIKSIPLSDTKPESEMISVEDVAKRLNLHPSTVRTWIRKDMKDGRQRIPGGRCEGTRYIIIRSVFERTMRHGLEPERTPILINPDLESIVRRLRERSVEDLELADQLAAAMRETQSRSSR